MKLVDLINNISTDVNNKKYYNNIVESDIARAISDSTTNLTSILLKENKKVDVTKLYETCIIPPNTLMEEFDEVPIFHRNGPEKNPNSIIICHFSILIDMLMKVYPEMKHMILKLSDLILNLTDLQDEDLESYINMSMSQCIKLLKEKDERLNEYKRNNKRLKNKNNRLIKEAKFRNTVVSQLKVKFHSDEMEKLQKQHEETIRILKENEIDAEERHKELLNDLEVKHVEILGDINNRSTSNLNTRITYPNDEYKKFYIRVYSTNIELDEDPETIIELIVNRAQKCNLKNLNKDEYKILYYKHVANAIEIYNNFIKKPDVSSYVDRTISGVTLKRNKVDKFIVDLSEFIENSNNLNIREIISNNINNNINNNNTKWNIVMFSELLKLRFYIRNRYRNLSYNSNENKVRFVLSSGEIIEISELNQLLNVRVRDRSGATYILTEINEIDNKFVPKLTKL